MPELRTGGSKTDMVSSARKQDSTKRRLLRAPRMASQKEGMQAMPGLNGRSYNPTEAIDAKAYRPSPCFTGGARNLLAAINVVVTRTCNKCISSQCTRVVHGLYRTS